MALDRIPVSKVLTTEEGPVLEWENYHQAGPERSHQRKQSRRRNMSIKMDKMWYAPASSIEHVWFQAQLQS